MHFVIYGMGVMGRALARRLSTHHDVSVVLTAKDSTENIDEAWLREAPEYSIAIVAVSSEGLSWLSHQDLSRHTMVLLICKTLVVDEQSCQPLHVWMKKRWPDPLFYYLAGPCLASELSEGKPGFLAIAGPLSSAVMSLRQAMLRCDITVQYLEDDDGVGYCMALKNIYAVFLSALKQYCQMHGLHNLYAAWLSRLYQEWADFTKIHARGDDAVWSLAGIADLELTMAQGRNGHFGLLWAQQQLTSEAILKQYFQQTTVEGVKLARKLMDFAKYATWQRYLILHGTITALSASKRFNELMTDLLHQQAQYFQRY